MTAQRSPAFPVRLRLTVEQMKETAMCSTRLALHHNAVKHFVAKLVKSFGRLGDAAESLEDFRDTKAWFLVENAP